MAIDPTARVADGARIGEGVEIGPFCLIGPQVELKAGVRLISHVNVTGVTTIGEGTVVYPSRRWARRRNRCTIAAARRGSSSARAASCARASP